MDSALVGLGFRVIYPLDTHALSTQSQEIQHVANSIDENQFMKTVWEP
jgi:hypothetical protein